MSGQPTPAEIDEMFWEYRRTERRTVRNQLIEAHRGLAATIAHDYSGRGVDDDDLRQIALLGILKAVERFDPERGIPFSAFASRTVNGEIKRYFRDRTWTVRPPRSAQERHLELRKATEELTQRNGRPPSVKELATELEITEDQVLEGMEASSAYRGASLEAPRSSADGEGATLGDRLADHETGYQLSETRILITKLLETLPEREAEILRLRFYEDLTQSEIADRVGVSQMHVSRLIRRSLLDLRRRMGDDPPAED
jgi:RNA polymerase sigma-B factor